MWPAEDVEVVDLSPDLPSRLWLPVESSSNWTRAAILWGTEAAESDDPVTPWPPEALARMTESSPK